MSRSSTGLNLLIGGLIGLGILLRLLYYIYNHSITLDEVYILYNLKSRDYAGLFNHLSYNQGAPKGFLLIEKFFLDTFGDTELSLRFFPFLCGIMPLLIFYKIASRYLEKKTLPIALGFFAISPHLLYYTSNFKQYSSDVLVGLLCLGFVDTIKTRKLSLWWIFILGLSGAILIWFSFPSVFVLAGVSTGMFLFFFSEKNGVKSPVFSLSRPSGS